MEKSVEGDDDGVLGFSWGKKIGTGGGGGSEPKDVQFYESFTYDGDEYFLYDCVLLANPNKLDPQDCYIGKIIKIWEHNDQRENPRRVELLWFFKPYMLSAYLEVDPQDVLPNELLLASGSGVGLTNEVQLEAISGKCDVICISKDARNRQPSDEEIESANFLFRRTFDVGTFTISEKIDDTIAEVDVKLLFNRTICEKEATVVKKVATDIQGTAENLELNLPLTSRSVRQNESNVSDCSRYRKIDYGCKRKEDIHCNKQLGRKDSIRAEERSSRDSVRRDGKDSYCLEDMPQKKRKLPGSIAVSDRRMKEPQEISRNDRRDTEPIRRPKDKVISREFYSQRPNFIVKKQDPRIPRFSEGKDTVPATEKGPFNKINSDGNISKHTEEKMLAHANYSRHYRVFEVTPKPEGRSKWFRDLPWEDNLKFAVGQGNLVLLQNLDPTYTSKEVENIIYSALNESCTARMIERTSLTIPHIGEALAIFSTVDAAQRTIRRLCEGCLLLSNGRTLVATNAKTNPVGRPPLQFTSHFKLRTRMREGMKNAVATSHCSQFNTIEFDMSMEWCLIRDQFELACKRVFERQIEAKRKLRIRFSPKLA